MFAFFSNAKSKLKNFHSFCNISYHIQIHRIIWQQKKHSKLWICLICSFHPLAAEQILIQKSSIHSEILL